MINRLIIIGILFLSFSCGGTKQQKGYVAEGELYVPERYIYLCVENEDKIDTILRTKIIDGKFRFEGITEVPQSAFIVCDDYKKIDLILENCKYNFKIDILDDSKIEAEISGEESKIYSCLDTLMSEFINKYEEIYKQIRKNEIAGDKAEILVSQLRNEYNKKENDLILRPNPNSFVAMKLVYDSRYSLSDEQFCQRFDLLGDDYSTHPTYKYLEKKYKIIKNIKVGNSAPNFTVMKENGDKLSLYDVKSKYKIIYITQLGSLSEENIDSTFKSIYGKYDRSDLEIIELSGEYKKEDWLKSLKNNGKFWLQIHLPDSLKNSILTEYNNRRTPYIYLLDSENKFLAIGATATEICKIVNTK